MKINVKYDGELSIAHGEHRNTKHWKNKSMLWSDVLVRCSKTHRTSETHKQYMAAAKDRQDEIKDVGGFFGGYLQGGRRKNGTVSYRQLVTLDVDFGRGDTWDDFTLFYGCAAAVYSTHKHSPDNPRLRLLIPLNREVLVDEYQAIARRIAGKMGIEDFDRSCFRPTQFMHWPSTPKDGEFIFEYQDGKFLDADKVLSSYNDWTDSSEWPVSILDTKDVKHAMKKQGDPLEKEGVIGAFCRTYDIHQAIEAFLDDTYELCDSGDRYTYLEGSTAGGLVIYDDVFAFSHHGTDPVSGKLCNAFDLVRVHKFGVKDEDVKEGTPGNRLPSYLAMMDYAIKDKSVRKLVAKDKLNKARNDFADVLDEEGETEDAEEVEAEEVEDDEWLGLLDADGKGNTLSTINNVVLILKNDKRLRDKFALDMFEHRELALKHLPWRRVQELNTRDRWDEKLDAPKSLEGSQFLTDKDDAGLRHYIETMYGIGSAQKIRDGLDMVLMGKAFHPVRDYLNALEWDGKTRVESVFIDYMGAADNEYTRAVTRKALVACVARILKPGIKFDNMLVLIGEQGKNKSEILSRLGGKWFSDSFTTIQGKEAFEQLQGAWIVEMAELSALKRSDVEATKHFVAKRVDRYRVAYGRRVENFPRQCVFFATTNERGFLRDHSGNRRFWPVEILIQAPTRNVWKHLDEDAVGQIWAECVELFKGGETLKLPRVIEDIAKEVQKDHMEVDEREGLIAEYLNKKIPENWDKLDYWKRQAFLRGDHDPVDDDTKDGEYGEDAAELTLVRRQRVCVSEIWEDVFGGKQKDMQRMHAKDIHNIMRTMPGWLAYKSKTNFTGYGTQRGYFWSHTEAKKYEKAKKRGRQSA